MYETKWQLWDEIGQLCVAAISEGVMEEGALLLSTPLLHQPLCYGWFSVQPLLLFIFRSVSSSHCLFSDFLPVSPSLNLFPFSLTLFLANETASFACLWLGISLSPFLFLLSPLLFMSFCCSVKRLWKESLPASVAKQPTITWPALHFVLASPSQLCYSDFVLYSSDWADPSKEWAEFTHF